MPDTIPALLVAATERDPGGTWLRTDEGALSFAGAISQVARTAALLVDAGARRGDLVVLTAASTPPYLLCWLALTSLGAVAVATDPSASAGELAGLLGQVRPRLLVTDAAAVVRVGEAVAAAGAPPPRVVDVTALVPNWRVEDTTAPPLPTGVGPDDLAVLIPTSGTTGRSKLVMQTHRAYAMAGEGFPYWMELTREDRLMTSLPLFHVNAPAYSVLGSLACGAGLVLLPRFSASGFLDSARRHGATEFNAVGAMLEILMRQPVRPDDADTPLRLCYTGPSPTQEWQEAFERRFGLRVVCGYGLSESPYGLIWARGTRPFGTLGSPRQHPRLGTVNQARVVDDEGRDVGTLGTGQLLLRNPAVTPGYWQMPEETAATVVDGWLHTGDLVTVNTDGTCTFVARRKEVLRRRGQNLSPAEVEDAVLTHPDVLEVAVVAVPSELTEDEVKAFVVARPGRVLDPGELRAWTAQRLSAFKVPRYWQVVDALPRTATARVAKHRLPAGHPPGEYDAQSPAARTEPPPGPPVDGATPDHREQGRTMTGYPTSLGSTDADTIHLLGQDLAQDLMGSVGLAELAFWLVALRRPTPGELRVLEAVMVALADHGLTPSAIAARLTLTGAPESVQGAMAAGLLGGGSRYLGVTEDAGRFLSEALAAHDATGAARPTSAQAWEDLARAAIQEQLASGHLVPGLGHPEHKGGDPRTPVLLRIAAEEGQLGPHLELFAAVGRVHPELLGRELPLNGAGACGAALCDLGLPAGILRGFALLARAAGLLGHLAEEMRRPIGQAVADDVRRAADYRPAGRDGA